MYVSKQLALAGNNNCLQIIHGRQNKNDAHGIVLKHDDNAE